MNGVAINKHSILKQGFLLVLCFYFIVQGFFMDMERIFFWGEILCVLLFFTIFNVKYVFNAQKRVIQYLYFWIFFVPLYGWWVTVTFWRDEYDPVYFWRSLVPIYYSVFFFFAYRWAPEILGLLKRFKLIIVISVLILVFYRGVGIGSSVILGFVWLGMQYQNKSWRFFWLTYCLLLMAILLRGGGGSTNLAALALILFPILMIISRWWSAFRSPSLIQKVFIRVLLLGVIFFTILGTKNFLDDIYTFMGAGQTQITYSFKGEENSNQHEFTNEFTNENARWRLFMWAYVLGRVWESPQGVGLGTPLFGNDMGKFFAWGTGDFEEMSYALGAHNSFLTLLGRFGFMTLVFLFLMGTAFIQIIRAVVRLQKPFKYWDSEFRLVFGSLVVLLIAFVMASFNMVIETPLYAAHFWVPLGLFVRLSGDYIAKQREKNQAVS